MLSPSSRLPHKHPASRPSATVSFRAAAPQLLPPEAGCGAVGPQTPTKGWPFAFEVLHLASGKKKKKEEMEEAKR